LNKVLLGFGNTLTVKVSTTGTAFILLVLAEESRTGVAHDVMLPGVKPQAIEKYISY
jgi:hypothetical protein